MGYTHHHRDKVIKKPDAPACLRENEDWEQVMEAIEPLKSMDYLKVVSVKFRNKVTGEIVSVGLVSVIVPDGFCRLY